MLTNKRTILHTEGMAGQSYLQVVDSREVGCEDGRDTSSLNSNNNGELIGTQQRRTFLSPLPWIWLLCPLLMKGYILHLARSPQSSRAKKGGCEAEKQEVGHWHLCGSTNLQNVHKCLIWVFLKPTQLTFVIRLYQLQWRCFSVRGLNFWDTG